MLLERSADCVKADWIVTISMELSTAAHVERPTLTIAARMVYP